MNTAIALSMTTLGVTLLGLVSLGTALTPKQTMSTPRPLAALVAIADPSLTFSKPLSVVTFDTIIFSLSRDDGSVVQGRTF